MKHLDSKVAIITGSGRGIGRATAVRLAQNGARIVAFSLFGEVYVSEDAGESWRKIAREFGEIRAAAWLPA